MKHLFHTFIARALATVAIVATLASCDYDEGVTLSALSVTVSYTGSHEGSLQGIVVEATSATQAVYKATTDANGTATIALPVGIYTLSANGYWDDGDYRFHYNGSRSQVTVASGTNAAELSLGVSYENTNADAARIVIKELYNGGVMKDDGSKIFQFDKCVILFNDGASDTTITNLCIGFSADYNAQSNGTSKLYVDGKLVYEDEGFIPAMNGIWYFPAPITIKAYSQLVINCSGAIDNTLAVSNSVNYADSSYYCMYDPEYYGGGGYYNNTNYYPSPSEVIPTSHYLKTIKYGQADAWPLSVTSPALFIFTIPADEYAHVADYAENVDNLWYMPGYAATPVHACLKIPRTWIIDAIEVFAAQYPNQCMKRLTADVDGGYIYLTHKLGHTLYRNVDKERTEAMIENEGLLVYNYSLGYNGSTDPSGIDAEASMANGAHIRFKDTNNASNDFHERTRCSLRK